MPTGVDRAASQQGPRRDVVSLEVARRRRHAGSLDPEGLVAERALGPGPLGRGLGGSGDEAGRCHDPLDASGPVIGDLGRRLGARRTEARDHPGGDGLVGQRRPKARGATGSVPPDVHGAREHAGPGLAGDAADLGARRRRDIGHVDPAAIPGQRRAELALGSGHEARGGCTAAVGRVAQGDGPLRGRVRDGNQSAGGVVGRLEHGGRVRPGQGRPRGASAIRDAEVGDDPIGVERAEAPVRVLHQRGHRPLRPGQLGTEERLVVAGCDLLEGHRPPGSADHRHRPVLVPFEGAPLGALTRGADRPACRQARLTWVGGLPLEREAGGAGHAAERRRLPVDDGRPGALGHGDPTEAEGRLLARALGVDLEEERPEGPLRIRGHGPGDHLSLPAVGRALLEAASGRDDRRRAGRDRHRLLPDGRGAPVVEGEHAEVHLARPCRHGGPRQVGLGRHRKAEAPVEGVVGDLRTSGTRGGGRPQGRHIFR